MTVRELAKADTAYAPPLNETWEPDFALADLSEPFRAFSCLFTPREKPKPQTEHKKQPKTQTIFSDRGYRRKITHQNGAVARSRNAQAALFRSRQLPKRPNLQETSTRTRTP
jgi:hypothetical protein